MSKVLLQQYSNGSACCYSVNITSVLMGVSKGDIYTRPQYLAHARTVDTQGSLSTPVLIFVDLWVWFKTRESIRVNALVWLGVGLATNQRAC